MLTTATSSSGHCPQRRRGCCHRMRVGVQALRYLGTPWVLWRAGYALRMKCGLLKRRFPTLDLERLQLADLVRPGTPTSPGDYVEFRRSSSARFFFEAGKLPAPAALRAIAGGPGEQRTVAVADDYARGRFLYYSRHVHDLGWPPDWLRNPLADVRHQNLKHWCDTPTHSPTFGDVKDVWEPSRFACAYWLVRAYAMTGKASYPEAFWELFESWRRQNPPNMGPNWKCGQETALRTMAWCFALFGFWNAPSTTPERVVDMVKIIAVQADRIAENIAYAVSQKNNHALSEAVGLLTTGLLFPELRQARRWQAIGRRVLDEQIPKQIANDGSYVQQSMNYHRVMLHDCLWAFRLADLNGMPFSDEVTRRVAKAGEFLFQMLDTESGCVPNYGPNDGAVVLPLAACDYVDYRPTVQAVGYQANRQLTLASGPWDEMLVWLFGVDSLASLRSAEMPVSTRFDTGGYYTIRGRSGWCMVRCHSYRSRPGHVDMLHIDLWHRGVNVLGDSGTYKYYEPGNPGMERYFKDISAHNTVEVDGAGPLELVSRFLWMPWPEARCLQHREDFWQGEHYGYNRPPWHVVHRRTIETTADGSWRVIDDLLGSGEHEARLRWHWPDGEYELNEADGRLDLQLSCGRASFKIKTDSSMRMLVCRGGVGSSSILGWTSVYYGEAIRRLTLEVTARCRLPAQFVSEIRFG